MKKLITLIIILFLSTIPSCAQPTSSTTLIIQEDLINQLLQTLGPLSGTSNINGGMMGSQIYWTVTNPRLSITTDIVRFQADVAIKTSSGLTYNNPAKGEASLRYITSQNIIEATITKATFELSMNILGNKFHLHDVDIARYYKSPVQIPVPIPTSNTFLLILPDSSTQNITMRSLTHTLTLAPSQLIVNTTWSLK